MTTKDENREEVSEDRISGLSEEELEALLRKLREFDLRAGGEEAPWPELGRAERRKRNPLLPA